MVTIKKYPNRRLYDTSQSKYINLDHIKTLINARTEFEIVDSKTNDVITSLLTDKLLQQLIRFYDSDMQPYVRQYLEQSLVQFIEQQDKVQSLVKNMVDTSPVGIFTKMMETNMQAWNLSKEKK